MKNITRVFNVINHNVFTIDGTMDYNRVMDCFIKLCELIDDFYDNDNDECVWYIGESTECCLSDLITGAYWHFTEWHSGQASKSYLCLSMLSKEFIPGMGGVEEDNVCYQMLNDMADTVRKQPRPERRL